MKIKITATFDLDNEHITDAVALGYLRETLANKKTQLVVFDDNTASIEGYLSDVEVLNSTSWDDAPKEATHRARDSNRDGFYYKSEPHIAHNTIWVTDDDVWAIAEMQPSENNW